MDDYITKKVKWFRIETIHGRWPCQDSWKIKTTLKNYSYIFNVSHCLHRIQTFHFAYLLHKAICRSRKYMTQTLRHDCFPIIPVIIPRLPYQPETESKLFLKSDFPLITPAPMPMYIFSVISLYKFKRS